MNEQSIISTDIPAWYELECGEESVIIHLRKETLGYLEKSIDWKNAPIIKAWSDHFGLGYFIPPSFGSNEFGFDGVIRRNRGKFSEFDSADWTSWEIFLPKRDAKTRILTVRASLAILFMSLSGFSWKKIGKISDNDFSQLLTIDVFAFGIEEGSGTGNIVATISAKLANWIKGMAIDHEKEIADAMQNAYRIMFSGERMLFFSITRNDPRLIHLCFSTVSSLDPVSSSFGFNNQQFGYELTGHDMNTSWVQLVAIVGLSKLCEIARWELNGLFGTDRR